MPTILGFNVSFALYTSDNDKTALKFFFLLVPMDLDVKMKAVMIGACFLIVSIN